MKYKITFFALLLITSVKAFIIHVPADYATIQAAILNAANTDTVEVAPGTYYENINFRGKKILLTSLFYLAKDTSYISTTIINGSTPLNADTASCVIFNNGEDSTAILQGFTLTGGNGTKWTDIHGAGVYREGGGIIIELGSPTIRYNVIKNNLATDITGVTSAGGGGIRIGDGNPHIDNNMIIFNQGKYGPGIVLNYTGCRIRNNIIASNSGATGYYGGGGIWASSNLGTTPKLIENNTIVANSSYAGGSGGIAAWSAAYITIRNNIIWGNTPATAQIKAVTCNVQATYNDVGGGYAGVGNINVNPLLDTLCFTLNIGSPCIDTGNASANYNDLVSSPGLALFPSMGTQRNDMGAFGGPYAFLMHCTKTTVSVNDAPRKNIFVSVFPNPASNEIKIEFNLQKKLKIEMFTLLGEKVLERTITSSEGVDVSGLPSGSYLIKILVGEGEVISKKIEIIRQ